VADANTLFRTNIQTAAAALALEPIGHDLAVDKASSLVLAHADAIQAAGADLMVRHRGRSDDIKAGIEEESPGVVINVLNRDSGRTSLLAAVAVETLENLVGDIIRRFNFAAKQSIKQDQLASWAVYFPAGGFIYGAVLIAISASDALVEGAFPLFQFL
jgi:hypothetical protein